MKPKPKKVARPKRKRAVKRAELIPQAHGGALLPGGKLGTTPGSGRPPSAIREYCLGSFVQRIPILEQIADGSIEGTASDKIKAVEALARYGGIDKLVSDPEKPIGITPDMIVAAWAFFQRIKSVEALELQLLPKAEVIESE